MTEPVSFNVRHTHQGTLLNIHLPAETVDRFDVGMQSGTFDGEAMVELSVLPEWITDPVEREQYVRSGQSIHIRVPIDMVNLVRGD